MRTSLVLICGLLAVSSFSILTAQTVCDSADHTIMAGSNYFNPGSLTLNAGETVAWINEGGFHDVNGIASAITGDPFGNPESFSLPPVQGNSMGVCMGVHTFTVPGTYDYDCSIGNHAADGMVATLTVEASAVECNDALACNYDETSSSDADCLYEDGTFNLGEGIWLVPGAALDPDIDCAIQPGAGILVSMNTSQGEPVTVVVDTDLEDYINGLVTAGLLTPLNGVLALSALENAVFSFCGNTMTGIAGLNTITSDWNGEVWEIQALGFNLAPYTTLEMGCPDPDALNYDPCANPDAMLCEYAATACDDPLACNYDSTSVGMADCVYFDTELFTLEENDFIDLFAFDECPDGYAGYNDLPVPLGQDSAGYPLTFTVFEEVAEILNEFGFELAVEDLSTATAAVCGTTLYYNSTIFGLESSEWDGHGFPNANFGSYLAPSSSYPEGCSDEEACNFDACSHPFSFGTCEYVITGQLQTADGDTGMVTLNDGDVVSFIATAPADGNSLDWFTECGFIEVDGNTATLTATGTGDCEVCVTESNAEGCEDESCIMVSVIASIGEVDRMAWRWMPNPAASDIRVEWNGTTSVFEVFDLHGRRVHAATLQPGTNTLDISTLKPGLYLAGPGGTALQRLAIQR